MKASEAVTQRINAGWTSACGGMAALSSWTYRHRPADEMPYRFLDVVAGKRRVQVCISPTGRSVRVFVDGEEAS